jgi:FkbM family methyltransferase
MFKRALKFLMNYFEESCGVIIIPPREQNGFTKTLLDGIAKWPQKSPMSLEWRLTETDRIAQTVSLFSYLRLISIQKDIDCVIDVGANKGQFAKKLRDMGYDGQILSFEPEPVAFSAISALSSTDDKWTVFDCGLSSACGAAQLNVYEDTSLSSFYEINKFGENLAGNLTRKTSTQEISIRMLDDFSTLLGGFSSILLKIDTQGHELDVLKGARSTLERTNVVLCECSLQSIYSGQATFTEITNFLSDLGYASERSFSVAMDRDLQLVEVDQFFLKNQNKCRDGDFDVH